MQEIGKQKNQQSNQSRVMQYVMGWWKPTLQPSNTVSRWVVKAHAMHIM